MIPMDVVWSDMQPVERYNQQLQWNFLGNFDSALSDCFCDLYKLYIAVSVTMYISLAVYMLLQGQPKHLVAVLFTGFILGVKLAAGNYAFTQVASGARHRLIRELAGQLSLVDGDLQFVVDTTRRFILPPDALFAFAQTVVTPICLLLSVLFENKRPLHFIAAIATIDFCWLVATPNSFNFFEKVEVLDVINNLAKIRAAVVVYG